MIIDTASDTETPSVPNLGSIGGFDGFDDRGSDKITFPIDCLPGIAGGMAREIARVSTCRSESLAASSVLGIVSASLGASLEISSGPDRRARGNLFFLVAADSGTGKTESFLHAVQPLNSIEAASMKIWEETVEPEIRSSIAILEARTRKLTGKAADASDPALRKQLAGELRDVEAERTECLRRLSSRPCFRVSDVTKEKLAILMQGQPGEAIASMSSEARGIVSILNGRYSTGGDIDFYCGGYSGDATYVDRVKNEGRILLKNPCLSILWMMQPDVVNKAFSSEIMTASGLLPRFITFDSQAEPQERDCEPEPITLSTKEGWHVLIADLCAMRSAAAHDIVPVSSEAGGLFRVYENENIRRRQSNGDLSDIAPFASRWAENAWRIGLVLHAASHGKHSADHELSVETAGSAIRLMRWFSNAQLDVMRKANREQSRSRMEHLRSILLKTGAVPTTLRTLAKNNGFYGDEVRRLVRSFPEKLSIKPVQVPNGGRPSTIIFLTPNRQNPQNPQNT